MKFSKQVVFVLIHVCFFNYNSIGSSIRDSSNVDSSDCSLYKILNGIVYLDEDTIKGCNYEYFKCIKYEYSKDNKSVFFGIKRMAKADPETFQVLDNGFCKDKRYVYYGYYSGKTIKNADPKSFKLLSFELSKDKHFVYINYCGDSIKILKGADGKTFKHFKELYYTDKHDMYNFDGTKLSKKDANNIRKYIDLY